MDRRLRDGQSAVKRSSWPSDDRHNDASDLHTYLERVTGIEPALSAWEADVLPLNYTRAAPGPNQPVARPDIVPDAFQQSGEGGDYLWA